MQIMQAVSAEDKDDDRYAKIRTPVTEYIVRERSSKGTPSYRSTSNRTTLVSCWKSVHIYTETNIGSSRDRSGRPFQGRAWRDSGTMGPVCRLTGITQAIQLIWSKQSERLIRASY